MSEERDRAPLSTEVAPLETEGDPYPSGRRDSKSPDAERVPGSSDDSETAGLDERLAIGQRLSGRYRIERELGEGGIDRKSTRLNSSHLVISYAVFCLK